MKQERVLSGMYAFLVQDFEALRVSQYVGSRFKGVLLGYTLMFVMERELV